MAEFKLDKIRFTWKGDWTTSFFYTKDDIVRYGGKSYVCLVGHTASSNFYTDLNYINTATEPDTAAPKWTLWFDGYAWKSNWTILTSYNLGDLVRYNGIIYVCTNRHTSAATTVLGLESNSSYWSVYTQTDSWSAQWLVSTKYILNDVVKYGGTIYRCITAHTSAATAALGLENNQSNWEIVTSGIEYLFDWTAITRYKLNDIVKYGANVWKCTTYHTSIATFEPAKWTIYIPGVTFRNNWDSATSYIPGDIIGYGGYNYTSITHNTNSKPSTNPGDWALVTKGFEVRGDWASITQYYVGDLIRQNGYVYVSIGDSLNKSPAYYPGFWSLVVTGVQWNNRWTNGQAYAVGDVVIYKSTSYKCYNDHTASSGNNPEVGSAYWQTFISGDLTQPLVALGDTLSYQSTVNTAIGVGTNGNLYKASGIVPYWGDFGGITNVYYVAPNGTNTALSGTTLANPFLTIKYACDFIRALAVPSATLFIKTGVYTETLPIIVAAGLELVGDEIRSTVVQPAFDYKTTNMFLLRNGTGIRNMTLTGLTGTLGAANIYGTSRPTAGAYVSLDPGASINDSSVWITTKSPYVQNVSTFGTGCTGLKIDGTLHNGGNRSIVANDFTQVLSDGIGVWCIGSNALVELVSVFSYYGHIGYLAEEGGKIRATNGNSSYGTFGTVSEGYDVAEIPLTGTVNNRNQSAQVAAVFAGQAQNKVLILEYSNAGQNYSISSPPIYTFIGAGTGIITVADNYRDNAIYEAMLTGSDSSAGGYGYLTAGNQAQSGTTTTIVIASNDQNLASNYAGMRVIITSGTGVGQYGYIQAYNSLTKTVSVYTESTDVAGWDHVIPGTASAATLDSTTVYSIEPRVTFSPPANGGIRALGRVTVGSSKISSIRIWNPGSGYNTTAVIAQFVGSVSGTILSVTALNLGSISTGMTLYGGLGNVASNTTITAQNDVSFTGFINGTVLTVTEVGTGSMNIGYVLTGLGIATGTTVTSAETTVFSGTVTGTTLTVASMGSGIIYEGMVLTGSVVPTGLYIVANISGAGTNSTWQISQSGVWGDVNINGIRYRINNSHTLPTSESYQGRSYTVSVSQTLVAANYYATTVNGAVATITDPNATSTAIVNCRVGNGVLAQPTFSNRGSNYQTSTTTCTISGGAGYADIYQISKYLTVSGLTYLPSLGASLTIGTNQTQYKIVNVTNLTSGTYYLQISPSITRSNVFPHGTAISIRQKYSQVRLTGHDYLMIGTGNKTTSNYPNVDVTTKKSYNQISENNLGRVFVTSTDEDGNFKVGNLFGVQQATGTVTISADLFNLSGLNQITLGGVQVGQNTVTITQFSTDQYFVANSDSIVPTQKAIKLYIANQISNGGSNAQTSRLVAGTVGVGPFGIFSSAGTTIKVNNKMNMTKGIDGVMMALTYFKSSINRR